MTNNQIENAAASFLTMAARLADKTTVKIDEGRDYRVDVDRIKEILTSIIVLIAEAQDEGLAPNFGKWSEGFMRTLEGVATSLYKLSLADYEVGENIKGVADVWDLLMEILVDHVGNDNFLDRIIERK